MRLAGWIVTTFALVMSSMAPACSSERSTDPAPAPDSGGAANEGTGDAPPVVGPPPAGSTPGSSRLLAEAQRILAGAKKSAFVHVTSVDETTGTFDFDCSGFVDYAMARAVPAAFTSLAAATVPRPVAKSYVAFTSGLAAPTAAWRSVARASDLVAGDIVAWLEPADLASTNTGHVMVVAGSVAASPGAVAVPVIDSSESGHGPGDARTTLGTTGIGQGTTVLLVDSNGAPTGYRWSTEAVSKPHATKVVLAHLQ